MKIYGENNSHGQSASSNWSLRSRKSLLVTSFLLQVKFLCHLKLVKLLGQAFKNKPNKFLKIFLRFLAEAGTDFDHVVKTTCFLSDMDDFVPFNEVYATAFKADFPARSAVEVARLPKRRQGRN